MSGLHIKRFMLLGKVTRDSYQALRRSHTEVGLASRSSNQRHKIRQALICSRKEQGREALWHNTGLDEQGGLDVSSEWCALSVLPHRSVKHG